MSDKITPQEQPSHFYRKLFWHVGHNLECVNYANGENIAIECVDCGTVIVDANLYEEEL